MTVKPQQQPIAVLRGHASEVTSVRFHPKTSTLYSGDLNGQMIEWNIATRRAAFTYTDAHSQNILQIHHSDTITCSQGREGVLKCWDLETKKNIHSLHYITPYETQQLSFCKFSMSGTLLALPHSKNVIALHHVNQPQEQVVGVIDPDQKMRGSGLNKGMLMSLCLYKENENEFLLCGMENGQTLLYDLRNLESPIKEYLAPRIEKKNDGEDVFEGADEFPTVGDPVLSLTKHGDKLICGTTGNALSIVSIPEQKVVKQYELVQPGISDVVAYDDHPDKIISRLLCTAGWDHRVRIYDLKRHKPLALYKYHTVTVNCVDIQRVQTDNQGYLLASGSKDNRIALWPLEFKNK